MSAPAAYRYDGSFEGFLCCVFDSVYRREEPFEIHTEDEAQETLYPIHDVETDPEKADRVFQSFSKKISREAEEWVVNGFLTCAPEKERMLLRFIRQGYRCGAQVTSRLADDCVNPLYKALRFLQNETHLLREFLRFSEQNGTLAAIVTPKNRVLPLLGRHFCDRYREETFLIYDETHREALLYRPHESVIVPLENFTLDRPDEQEARFRSLWKCFYDTIAIEGRYNPKCRMNHMPKRYWKNLVEFQDLLPLARGGDDAPLPAPAAKSFLQAPLS